MKAIISQIVNLKKMKIFIARIELISSTADLKNPWLLNGRTTTKNRQSNRKTWTRANTKNLRK